MSQFSNFKEFSQNTFTLILKLKIKSNEEVNFMG